MDDWKVDFKPGKSFKMYKSLIRVHKEYWALLLKLGNCNKASKEKWQKKKITEFKRVFLETIEWIT